MSKQQNVLTTAALAILLAAASSPAPAQLPMPSGAGAGGASPRIRVGFGGGASVPIRRAGDVLERGVNGQAFVLLSLLPGFPPLRLNLGYQKFDYKDLLAGGTTTGESQVLSGVAGLSLSLIPAGPIRPYLLAGLGAFSLKDDVTASGSGGSQSVSEMRFGVDGGGGIAFKLGRLEAFIEGRIQNVFTSETGVIDTRSIQYVPVTFGIVF